MAIFGLLLLVLLHATFEVIPHVAFELVDGLVALGVYDEARPKEVGVWPEV